ncbi:MAG: spore cortex biosynthesis protein YabQ [Lachnospiraceae bacterium]|nr:spore cortex biosynthesis protein YabQ [Lachnospiraceae bacterium]
MNDAVIPELELLAFSFLSGIICFFGYDLLLVLRIFFRRSLILEKLEDILYWLAASIFVFSVIYKKNSGVIRGYSIAGMLAGMILYRAVVKGRLTQAAQRRSDRIRKWFRNKTEPIRKKRMELQNKRKQVKIKKEEQKKNRKQKKREEREKRKKKG